MTTKNNAPLTPVEVCALMACEAVSMLDAAPDTLNLSSRADSLREELAEVRMTLQVDVEPPAGPTVQQEVL